MTAQQANQQTLPECSGNLVGQDPRRPQSPDRRRYRGICRGHRQARADAEALRALGAMEGPRGRRHQSLEGHALMPAEFARLARRAGSGQVVRTGTDDATDAGDLRGNEAAVGHFSDVQRNVHMLLEQVDVAIDFPAAEALAA